MAAKKRLSAIALTDHETVAGIKEMIEAGAAEGVYVIPGVEIESSEGNFLGYFIDYEDEKFLSFLEGVRRMHESRIGRVVQMIAGFDFDLDMDSLKRFAHPGKPTLVTIAQMLVNQRLFPDVRAVFSFLEGMNALAFQSAGAPDAESCIQAIRDAGGVAVKGNPSDKQLINNPRMLQKFLSRMVRLGIAGCETVKTRRASLQAASSEIMRIVEQHDLVPLSGSNFHGDTMAGGDLGSRTMGGDHLFRMIRLLPSHTLYRDYFSRMYWRSENLSPEEFKACLCPKEVHLSKLEMKHLMDRPPLPDFLANPKETCPFVLIGPGAMDNEEAVIEALKNQGAQILSIQTIKGYPELAWDLQGLPSASEQEKEGEILRLNLDRHLYGTWMDTCRIAFFEPPFGKDLAMLKKEVRREIGNTRSYRVRCGDLADTCFTSLIHIPQEKRVPAECHRLREHGVAPPHRETMCVGNVEFNL